MAAGMLGTTAFGGDPLRAFVAHALGTAAAAGDIDAVLNSEEQLKDLALREWPQLIVVEKLYKVESWRERVVRMLTEPVVAD